MPKILEDAVKRIRAKGVPESNAWAMATSTLQKAGELKEGTNQPTKLGVKRGKMTRAQRHAHPLAAGGRIEGCGKGPNLGRPGRR